MGRLIAWFCLVGVWGTWSGCVRTQADAQRDRAKTLLGVEFWKALPEVKGPVRTIRARVWAQEDYRRAILGWEMRFYKSVQRINRVLRARFAVEIELESMRPWPGEGRLGSLEVSLASLEAVDAGEDVDLVVGLVTPLTVATSAIHQLGMARLLSKHMVLRGMDDAQEFSRLTRALSELSSDERERVYVSRRAHKEVVVFLHEFAHILGALHVRAPLSIMAPEHHHQATSFAPRNLQIMKLALSGRGEGQRDTASQRAARAKVLAYLEKTSWEGWTGFGREQLITLLSGAPEALFRATDRAVLGRDDPSKKPKGYDRRRAEAEATLGQEGSDQARLQEARTLAGGGDIKGAARVLAPLLKNKGEDPEVAQLACEIHGRAGSEDALALCVRATQLAPKAAGARLLLVYVLVERKARARALSEARVAEGLIKDRPEQFELLAQLYQRLGAVHFAERAAKQAGSSAAAVDVLAWVKKTRAEFELDGRVLPREESEYLELRRALGRAAQAGLESEVRRISAVLKKRFPKAPGADAVVCAQLGAQQRFSQAVGFCERARAASAVALQPRLILGMAAFALGKPRRAVAPLEEALVLAEGAKEVWRLLYRAYLVSGRRKRAERLSGRYRKKFGAALR